MPQNVWTVGSDSLHKQLAERDAKARLEREEQRRLAADQRQLSLDAEQADYRRGLLGVQQQQADSLEKERLARTAEIERGSAQKTEEAQLKERLIAVVTDPEQPQKMRDAAGLRLDALGVKPEALKAYMTQPKPESQGVFRTNPRTGTVDQIGEVPKGSHFVTEPAPPREPAGPKDNPKLPAGVTAWIDSIAQRGIPPEQARMELSKGWKQQIAAHPHAQLSDAAKYLDTLYPKDALGQRENVFGADESTPSTPSTPQQAPIPGIPGGVAELRDGQWIRIK